MAFVSIPHPVGGIGQETVRTKVEAIFPDILRTATQWKATAELPPQKPIYPAERFQFRGTVEDVNKLFFEKGWSLGLPVIPPTPERVEAMLKGTNRKPDELLWEVPPRKGALTVELVAVHAVMAGCKPEYMPLLLAIVEGMKDPIFDWAGQTTTTNPTFPLIIVNGPIVKQLGIASGQGAAGGGYHPNVSIGYFVNLIGDIVGGSKAPEPDKSTQGQAGNIIATVIGENMEALPKGWKPLNVERGFGAETSTVTVADVEGSRNMNIAQPDTAKGVLDVIAIEMETIGPNNAVLYRGSGEGDVVLALCPQHAATIARGNMSKEDIKQYLFDNARVLYEKWRLNLRTIHLKDPWYAKFKPGDRVPVVDGPKNIIVVVFGGAGTHSQYFTGFMRPAVTKEVK
jgi:hypothetical protein